MADENLNTEDVAELEEDAAGDEEAAKEPTLDELKAELAKTKRALTKANNSDMKRRLAEEAAKKDPDKESAEIAGLRLELQRKDAAEAIRDAKDFNGTMAQAKKLVRTMDSVDPKDVDDQIEALREEFPQFFGKVKGSIVKVPAMRTGGGASDDKSGPKPVMSPMSERMLRAANRA